MSANKTTKKSRKINKIIYKDIYYNSDNNIIHGIYYGREPTNTKKSGLIIYARGGNNHPIHKNSMNLNKNDFYKTWLYHLVKNHNYIVLGCDFRGSYGSTGEDDIAGNDINDIINLYHFAMDNYGSNINKNTVYLYGESMGVYKSLIVASQKDYFSGLILLSGVYNLESMRTFRPYLYKHWQKDYKLTSDDIKQRDSKIIISKIIKNIPKIIIFHGNEDTKASITEMLNFTNLLLKNKFTNFDCHILHNGNHALIGHDYDIYYNITRYFEI